MTPHRPHFKLLVDTEIQFGNNAYDTYNQALQAAKELQAQNPGKVYAVVRVMAIVKTIRVSNQVIDEWK